MMKATPPTPELNKATRLRNILLIFGICILATVTMNLFTRPFNILLEGIEILLGISSLIYSVKQNKVVMALHQKAQHEH